MLNCAEPLQGRIDKKFCSDQCRASYHNQRKRKQERVIQAVNRQVRKNRAILKKLCPDVKSTVRKALLIDLGFSFQYFSSLYREGKLQLLEICNPASASTRIFNPLPIRK